MGPVNRQPTALERRATRSIFMVLVALLGVIVTVVTLHGWVQVLLVLVAAFAVAGTAFNCGAYVTDSHMERRLARRDRGGNGQVIEGEV